METLFVLKPSNSFLNVHFTEILTRWELITQRARAERFTAISDRVLGGLWFLLLPFAEILIYYVLVVVVFNSREFYGVPAFLGIVAGIVHFLMFQRIVMSNITTFVDERNLLLQIKISPITFLVIKILNQLKDSIYLLCIFFFFMAVYQMEPNWMWLLYPFLLLFIIFVAWSFSILLATLYVFFRDINELVVVSIRLVMYSSPVVYASAFIPDNLINFYFLNPFAVLFAFVGSIVFSFPLHPLPHIILATTLFFLMFFFAHHYYESKYRKFTKVI